MDPISNEWEAELEKELENIRDMNPEEADAVLAEACERTVVTLQEANHAISELEKAVGHFRATREKYSRTVLEKIGSHQTLEEDVKEANAKCDAATDAVTRALCAAKRAAVKSKRILEAITKAREKRPMTECEGQGASCSY